MVSLLERMKTFERDLDTILEPKAFFVLRLDGKGFSSYTKDLQRPFDAQFASDMNQSALSLVKQLPSSLLAFVQSDEISVVFTDLSNDRTQLPFGGKLSKILSVSASMVSVEFNRLRPLTPAFFDARLLRLPSEDDVLSYLLWRQNDCEHNSLMMTAQTHFSHRQLQGVGADKARLMLEEKGVFWARSDQGFRQGRLIVRSKTAGPVTFFDKRTQRLVTDMVERHNWVVEDAFKFPHDPDRFESLLKF